LPVPSSARDVESSGDLGVVKNENALSNLVHDNPHYENSNAYDFRRFCCRNHAHGAPVNFNEVSLWVRARETDRATLGQLIAFDHCYARGILIASNDGGVVSRRETADNGAFKVVRRGKAGRNDRCLLIGSPVIIESQ
jgi:hypothetical protein